MSISYRYDMRWDDKEADVYKLLICFLKCELKLIWTKFAFVFFVVASQKQKKVYHKNDMIYINIKIKQRGHRLF